MNKKDRKKEKQDRLAKALRDNLKRRRQQTTLSPRQSSKKPKPEKE